MIIEISTIVVHALALIPSIYLAGIGYLALKRGLPESRQHSLEQRRVDAFHEVMRYIWGLTESNHQRVCEIHVRNSEENVRCVRALNLARIAFCNTEAGGALETYLAGPTVDRLDFAIKEMAKVCSIDLPRRFDSKIVFSVRKDKCDCKMNDWKADESDDTR